MICKIFVLDSDARYSARAVHAGMHQAADGMGAARRKVGRLFRFRFTAPVLRRSRRTLSACASRTQPTRRGSPCGAALLDVPAPEDTPSRYVAMPSLELHSPGAFSDVAAAARDPAATAGASAHAVASLVLSETADRTTAWQRHEKGSQSAPYGVGSNSSPSQTPAHGSPVTLRTVLPQASRVGMPARPRTRSSSVALRSGTW